MAAKLSWTELRHSLAKRAGVSEQEANTFLQAFNTQLIEALKQEKQVKVNGLGVFKLQAVAPRKSVNVSTGEAITIEGYHKINFVAEAGVKELVEKSASPEKPAMNSESAIVDPIQKLGAQAEEIVDILGELGQSPKAPKAPETPKEKKTRKKPVVAEAPKAEETAEAPVAAPEPEPMPAPEIPVAPEIPATPEEPAVPKQTQAPKGAKQYHFVRDTLICVVVLLLLLLIGYFFLRNRLSNWLEEKAHVQPQTEQVVAEEPEEAPAVILEEERTEEVEENEVPEYSDLITIEPMHEASRLAWMAKRYYGKKVYWPYLYDANKDHITNPSEITVGTPIRVPKLSAAQRDTTTAEFARLKKEAEEACKK